MEIESAFARAFAALDAFLTPLLAGRWWFLRVGALAIVLSLIYNSPSRWDWNGWCFQVLQQQADHPLRQPNPWGYDPKISPLDDGLASHLDKISFRLTIPVLGKVFHTGKYSWFVFTFLAGLMFYPLLALVTERWLKDRRTAMYLTAGFALSWAGRQFFFDPWVGDGVAWFFLLASIASNRPLLIFFSVLAAAFTDERGLIATSGTLLFWALGDEKVQAGKEKLLAAAGSRWKQKGAVIAAWLAYAAIRLYLGSKFGLRTGTSLICEPAIVISHLRNEVPYSVFSVFEGLWIWLLIGFVGLLLERRYLAAGGYAGIYLSLAAISFLVWDIQRSLAYAVILFPLVWRAGALAAQNALFLSRLTFLLGLVLVSPRETPLRYLHHIHFLR